MRNIKVALAVVVMIAASSFAVLGVSNTAANCAHNSCHTTTTTTTSTTTSSTTTSTSTTTSVVESDPSGQPMPIGDVTGWHQVFADNFANESVPLGSWSGCVQNGSVLTSHCSGLPTNVDTNWWAYPDGWSGTPSDGTYYPSKGLSIQGGVMDMWVHSETINGVDTHIINAPIPKDTAATGSWGGQIYGKYIVRMKLDSTVGYHLSFLWWPDSNVWPQEGSIDWPEAEFDQPDTDAFLQWRGNTTCVSGNCQQDYFPVNVSMSSGWHTYEIDWTANTINYLLDGQPIGQSTDPSHIPNMPLHWVLQTGRSFSETVTDAASSHVQIDWATIYQQCPSCT